jgi:hypothetical protein
MNSHHAGDEVAAYRFDDVDRTVVSITRQLIQKVLLSRLLRGDAQRNVVRAVARVFAELPRPANKLNASVSVIGPTRKFGDHEVHHYWAVEVEDHQIEVRAGGDFYRPSTGGDSFTSFYWVASPGCETDCQDYLPTLGIVDDAKPFGTEIDELDLNEPGYSIGVTHDRKDVPDETSDEHNADGEPSDDAQPLPELAACLWAFMDASTQLIYALGGRAYSLAGSDAAKLQVLRELSRHDYRTVKRMRVPERLRVCYADGSKHSGVAPPSAMNDPNIMLFEDVFAEIEEALPPLPAFVSNRPTVQRFPNDLLCVRTLVYEDAAGNCRAIVDDEDQAWLEHQL